MIPIQEFLTGIIQKNTHLTPLKQREFLEVGQILDQGHKGLDANARTVIMQHLALGTKNKNDFIASLCHSISFAITGKGDDLQKAVDRAFKASQTIENLTANLNALSSMQFQQKPELAHLKDSMNASQLRLLWRKNISLLGKLIEKSGLKIAQSFQETGRTVILTQQLLGPGHAPSRDAFEFTKALQKKYGRKTLLVSSLEFSPRAGGSLLPAFTANAVKDYSGRRQLDYEGCLIDYYQPPDYCFDDQSILGSLKQIEDFDPDQIIVVGTRNLLAEVFHKRAFVFIYPTMSMVPPLTEYCFFMSWREASENEQKFMRDEKIFDKHLFAMHPNFTPPKRGAPFSRAALNIPEDRFVFAIVGNRLAQDSAPDFLDMLEKIAEHPKAHFAFFGQFATANTHFNKHPKLAGRYTIAGFQSDIMSALDLCNAYLNPRRSGGGSAIIYALLARLPALSLPVGDAYQAVRDFDMPCDYHAMAAQAISLIDQPDFYEKLQEKSYQAGLALSDGTAKLDRAMAHFEDFKKQQKT